MSGAWTLVAQAGDLIPFTIAELAFIAVYLLSLIAIGLFGFYARRENSLRDFYLAGPGIGFVVLLLTLYATQYSGNTLFGFSGATYRRGYSWALSIHFMTAIVVFYLLLAPKLTSVFHSRSPTHHEPHSTTAYFRPGKRSNLPEKSSCHNARWVQNGTSATYMATLSP